ncbi:MAG: ABC transporter substrate-binding protein, partial [Clostridia bacterium]|nr:ABC transporter substrate-binding protein [Clostridia bacterium]
MKKWASLILSLLMTFSIAGCHVKTSDTIIIGILPDTGAIPFIAAYENGYFSEQGLSIELKLFYSAVDRDTALQTKAIDGAMTDTMALIFFNDSGLKIKALFNTTSFYYLVSGSENKQEGTV